MEVSPGIGKEMVGRCKAGDRNAFEKIVLYYQKRVYNFAYRMLGNREEARDLSQEIFVSVFESIQQLRDDAKFDGWLKQITVNHCRNRWKFLKRRQYFRTESLDDPVETEKGSFERSFYNPSDNPAVHYERKATQEWVQKALLQLREEQREIIVLRDLQELSYEEIGQILGLPEGTVKSKLHRARMDLKDVLCSRMH